MTAKEGAEEEARSLAAFHLLLWSSIFIDYSYFVRLGPHKHPHPLNTPACGIVTLSLSLSFSIYNISIYIENIYNIYNVLAYMENMTNIEYRCLMFRLEIGFDECFSYRVRVHREIPRCMEDKTTFPKGKIFFEILLRRSGGKTRDNVHCWLYVWMTNWKHQNVRYEQ